MYPVHLTELHVHNIIKISVGINTCSIGVYFCNNFYSSCSVSIPPFSVALQLTDVELYYLSHKILKSKTLTTITKTMSVNQNSLCVQ